MIIFNESSRIWEVVHHSQKDLENAAPAAHGEMKEEEEKKPVQEGGRRRSRRTRRRRCMKSRHRGHRHKRSWRHKHSRRR